MISGNVFYGNRVPMTFGGNVNLEDSNRFHDPANPAVGNTFNGAFMSGSATQREVHAPAIRIWHQTDAPVVAPTLYLKAGGSVVVMPGTVVKFTSNAYVDRSDNGGFSYTGAVLTSYLDDEWGGDTNGDGAATTPSQGDWAGIWLGGSVWAPHDSTALVLYAANPPPP